MTVLDSLRRQLEKYREMVSLVASQREVFASMDVDAILALIERKRAILADVDALEAQLAPMKAQWAKVRTTFTPDDARAIEATLDETQQVLRELVRLEDEGRALLDKRREEKTAALDQMLSRSRARGAYGAR
jgi:flagellar biosynthesis/type III secretory pathway chaperone